MVLDARVQILEQDYAVLRAKAAAFDEVTLQLMRVINIISDLTELLEGRVTDKVSDSTYIAELMSIRWKLDEVAETIDAYADPSRYPVS